MFWNKILPLAALLGSVGLFAAGTLTLQAQSVLLCAALNGVLWGLWVAGRRKCSRDAEVEKRVESEK